jgi:hypothetical protein
MRRRRAMSLVELTVVMSSCTLILTLSTVLIHRVMRHQSQTRLFFDAQRSGMRLSEQFRRDVHEATTAVTTELPEGVFLRLRAREDQSIDYQRTERGILRLEMAGEETSSRDEFRFPNAMEAVISREEAPALIILEVKPRHDAAGGSPRPNAFSIPTHLQVQGHLGRMAQEESP